MILGGLIGLRGEIMACPKNGHIMHRNLSIRPIIYL
jgi:hypothetical protein